MPSAAYQFLEAHGFQPLGSYGWHEALRRGQVVVPDYNEQGPRGSLLHLMLSIGRPDFGYSKNYAEEPDFLPDPAIEELVIWTIEQGADPWARHNGKNAWSEAVYRGWPLVLAYLAQRPDAPPKHELETEPVIDAPGLSVPAAFGRCNQIEALQAWAGLGLSVNLGVESGRSAGTEAATPEFLEAWAKLGGAIAQPAASGRPLKDSWKASPSSWRVAMERVWLKYQPKEDRSVDDRLDEAVATTRNNISKTLYTHRIKALEVSPTTQGTDGRALWERWWAGIKAPEDMTQVSPAVVDFLLKPASDEVVWEALVAGLKTKTPAQSKNFPTLPQLETLVSSGRFGSTSKALKALATELKDFPSAMLELFRASRSLRSELELEGEPRFPLPDEPPSYRTAIPALANFWGEWFFTPSPSCPQGQGWEALSKWMPRASWDENALDYSIYRRILSPAAGFDERHCGAELLGVMELFLLGKRNFYRLPESILDDWRTGRIEGWAAGVAYLDSPSNPIPRCLVDLTWDFLAQRLKDSSASIGALRTEAAARRMEASLSAPGSNTQAFAARPRL